MVCPCQTVGDKADAPGANRGDPLRALFNARLEPG